MRPWLCNCQVRLILLACYYLRLLQVIEDSLVGGLIVKHVDPGLSKEAMFIFDMKIASFKRTQKEPHRR